MKGGAFFADRSIYLETVAYLGVIAIVLAALAVAVRRRNAAVIAFAAMTVFMFCLVFVPPVVSRPISCPSWGHSSGTGRSSRWPSGSRCWRGWERPPRATTL